MTTIKLFVFSSESLANIEIGVKEKMWAVSMTDDITAAGRYTRSLTEMCEFSRGLLYAADISSFTVPFRTRSRAEDRLLSGVWSDTWRFPFTISPLGNTSTTISLATARRRWPFLQGMRNPSIEVRGMAGLSVFSPNTITQEDWDLLLKDLNAEADTFSTPLYEQLI